MGFLPCTPAHDASGVPARMIGPNNSGRSAARIITAQPAWQLPITQGLPSASGCRAITFSRNTRLGAGDVLDGLARHWFRQEPDEITRVAGLERHANLAVGFEAPYARAMAGARIDDHERPAVWIDFDPLRRNDPDEGVIDWPLERAAIDEEFHRAYSSTCGATFSSSSR